MLEKDIENLIAEHPEDIFKGEGFRLIGQQYPIEGKRIDILFEDRQGRTIIIEVKRGILNREASGQIAEYYGLLKSKNKDYFYEMILCANVIPPERRLFLENIGIECKELGFSFISELAKKYDYTLKLTSKRDIQLRDNAMESARQVSLRVLEKNLGPTGYFIKLKPYPFHILRENPVAQGAGADRFSTGMQKAFGKPIGNAARIKKGQTIFEVGINKANLDLARKALQRASQKMPCSCLIQVTKNK